MQLVNKAKELISDVFTFWNVPPTGKYVPFKGIFGYSIGGIGAYMIITLGTACLLSANNTLLTMTLGVDPTDVYIMYAIAVIANIPLTGIRANIIDNTRNKAGKYRPYILTMAIPSAVLCLIMVWFPYDSLLPELFGGYTLFGEPAPYVAKCAIILVLNLLLHFFYYFFYDAYENLIHVLSPDSQERANISSVKSIVYSFAPTLVNLFTPIIAENIFHTTTTDIRVYKLLYPILTVLGLLLCILVYKNTEEKIVQAKTHVVQIKFTDALKAVAKNKYFWIISLAGWIGFLETSYANILNWLYNYGGACNGDEYGIIVTVYGNASLWGMLMAPFAIKKWGKKAVLIVTNLFNILFILLMLPCCQDITNATIWLVMGCLWLNALMGSFAHILNPSIQADIRDYQQYTTGERIDGMFSAVATIGTVITLVTSGILPYIYERSGLTRENALRITSDPTITSRVLGNGKTVAQILQEQMAEGQNNYENATSALYDTDILLSLLKVLILLAAFGALMNVIPYIWYDFNEKKQKSVVRVLKVRAMFEDYGNNITNDAALVEGVDIIRNAKELKDEAITVPDKKSYKNIKDKEQRKLAKKEYNALIERNKEIEISKFVCDELERFSSKTGIFEIAEAESIYALGKDYILSANKAELKAQLKEARSMPKETEEEKAIRKICLENARRKLDAFSAAKKYFKGYAELIPHEYSVLEALFEAEDALDEKIRELNIKIKVASKAKDNEKKAQYKAELKTYMQQKKEAKAETKAEMNYQAYFNRAAKPFLFAERLLKQQENYTHLEDISAKYDDSKERLEIRLAEEKAEQERLKAEKAALKRK